MAALLRSGALLAGFVLGVGVLGVVSTVLPGAWLPLAYSLLALGLTNWALGSQGRGVGRRALTWWSLALVLDVFFLWSTSVDPDGLERVPSVGRFVVPAMEAAAAIATIVFAIRASGERRWLWALLIPPAIVAFVSSGRGGPSPFLRFFHDLVGLSMEAADTATVLTRKVGHFAFYGTVGLLAVSTARAMGLGRRQSFLFGALYPLLLACFDELRQSAYQNRTGTPWDVLLDMSGVAVFLFVLSRSASFQLARPERSK